MGWTVATLAAALLHAALPRAAGAAPSTDITKFTGRVVDVRGKPISGATILWQFNRWWPGEGKTFTSSATDGSFSGTYRSDRQHVAFLLAVKPGYGIQGAAFSEDKPPRRVVFRLPPAAPFHGKVTSRAGEPVAGATLRLVHTSWSGKYGLHFLHPALTVTTDAAGVFQMPWLVDGEDVGFWLQRPGYAAAGTLRARAPGSLAVTLTPEAQITGMVLWSDPNIPASERRDFSIWATRYDQWQAGRPNLEEQHTNVTTDGSFALKGLNPGDYVLHLHDHGHRPPRWVISPVLLRKVKAGETRAGLQLRASRGGIVSGMVRKADGKTPAAHSMVYTNHAASCWGAR
jgi:hypothetical protein